MGTVSRPCVLLVDDYRDTVEMYAAYLDAAGFWPLKALNGYEALRVAAEEVPDLIVMDLGLPGMDGFEVTARLKQDPRTAHIPVVALTAHPLPAPTDGLRFRDFIHLITKPCLPEDLLARIERVLSRTWTDGVPVRVARRSS